MTEGAGAGEARIIRALSLVLVAGAGIRLLAAVVAGFVEWHNTTGPLFPTGRARAFDVLTVFGAGGDGTAVLVALAAAMPVWWLSRHGDPLAEPLRSGLTWLFGVTAALAVAEGIGIGILYSVDPTHQVSRLIQTEGFALAYLVIAVGAIVLLRQFGLVIDAGRASEDIDAFVFAVDRRSGDVRAFLSVGEARRRMHVYSIEDDEFAFYTDEGGVLDATVEDDQIALRPTEEQRQPELLDRLKEFANRRGIAIDEADVDDPTAYAVPIGRWRWLEMWPPWLRPIGMLFRRTG